MSNHQKSKHNPYLNCQRSLLPNSYNSLSGLCQRISRLESLLSLSHKKKIPFNAMKCPSNISVKITILTSRVCRLEKILGFKPKVNFFPGTCGGGSFPNPQTKINRLCGRVARLEKLVLA